MPTCFAIFSAISLLSPVNIQILFIPFFLNPSIASLLSGLTVSEITIAPKYFLFFATYTIAPISLHG